MRRWMLYCRWLFVLQSRAYSKTGIPSADALVIDATVQNVTKGRLGWVGAHLVENRCAVCNEQFWTEKPRPICGRARCYVEYHLRGKE